jgi:uncharacterized protein (UPF0371 family)
MVLMKRGFDTAKYIRAQSAEILKRVRKFKRLYLEFGGKLIYDDHAFRVLPGYEETAKAKILKKLRNFEIVYCINARDLQSNQVLGKRRRSYQNQALKDLRDIKKFGLKNEVIVITRFSREKKAKDFAKILEKSGKRVYFHKEIKGYSKSITKALNSYKIQPYIPIKSNLIVVSGPASGSGKMAVILSQVYHEKKKRVKSGFAKFETFPVWNLPLAHPINRAYEAATADLQDKVMIDPYHKKAYGKTAVNYNRDIKNFSILKAISKKITGKKFPYGYKSPTDMGIGFTKSGIIDEEVCKRAALKEIQRRDKFYKKEFRKGRESRSTLKRMEEILRASKLT